MAPVRYGVVLVTTASPVEARELARHLLEQGLAACINFFPVHSTYLWQGERQETEEWQLVIKTDLARFESLEAQIQARHSYDVPEIIALEIVNGSRPYLQWLESSLAAP
jgi:periplasmic divalent cation tolerance protein